MRGFKGSGSAIQWSLSGNIRTWGGLQCHMRGYIWLYGCYSMVSKWYYQGHGAGTRINRGRRGTAISGIWPSRSRYRENDRDNRDKWAPKKRLLKLLFAISSRVSLLETSF